MTGKTYRQWYPAYDDYGIWEPDGIEFCYWHKPSQCQIHKGDWICKEEHEDGNITYSVVCKSEMEKKRTIIGAPSIVTEKPVKLITKEKEPGKWTAFAEEYPNCIGESSTEREAINKAMQALVEYLTGNQNNC